MIRGSSLDGFEKFLFIYLFSSSSRVVESSRAQQGKIENNFRLNRIDRCSLMPLLDRMVYAASKLAV